VLLLLEATVPPWFQDDLTYHLPLPRLCAASHGYATPDDNIFKAFPLGWETILATVNVLGHSPDWYPLINPRLVTVWVGIAAAFATAGLARTAGARREHAAWAGALFLLVPTFAEFSTLCYVEAYLVLLSTLALTCVLRACDGEEAFLIPAALLAGATTSVKYTGLAVCAGLVVLLIVGGARRGVIRFIAIGAVVGSPFYIRNFLERGNPFFPLAFSAFGGLGWDEWRASGYDGILRDYGAGRDWSDYLLLPFRLLAAHATKAEFEASLGPSVALGAVAALAVAHPRTRTLLFTRPRRAAALAVFALFWFLFWAATTQQGRMFLTAVPPLIALAACALSGLARERLRLARGVTVALVLSALAWAAPAEAARWNYQNTSEWLSGKLDSNALLSLMLPDTYPIEREAEKIVSPGGKIWLVWMHNYTYYLRRPWIADQIFEDYRFSALIEESADPQAFRRALEARGVTHVLLHQRFFLAEGSADTMPGRTEILRKRFGRILEDGVLVPRLQRREVVLYEVSSAPVVAAPQ